MNIIILHFPTMYNKPQIPSDLKPIIKQIKKYGKVYHYFFKFSYYGNVFHLSDLLFENVAIDIHNTFKSLKKYLIIAINHACPMGLYYADKYPKHCQGIVCYPFRFYSKESYERRIWKFKNNKGWDIMVKNPKYDIDNYLLKINDARLQELFTDPQEAEKQVLYLIMDFYLQKQYYKIPKVFKTKTILYTRLDLDVPSIIKGNYKRKEIAVMKQIINESDALYNSMIWNFDRIKYDAILKNANKNNNFLKIKYLVSGWEDYNDIVDEVILFKYKN